MLYLHVMMMPVRHPFSAFAPENMPLSRENQYHYIRFDSLNPPFQFSRTHHSNCGAKLLDYNQKIVTPHCVTTGSGGLISELR